MLLITRPNTFVYTDYDQVIYSRGKEFLIKNKMYFEYIKKLLNIARNPIEKEKVLEEFGLDEKNIILSIINKMLDLGFLFSEERQVVSQLDREEIILAYYNEPDEIISKLKDLKVSVVSTVSDYEKFIEVIDNINIKNITNIQLGRSSHLSKLYNSRNDVLIICEDALESDEKIRTYISKNTNVFIVIIMEKENKHIVTYCRGNKYPYLKEALGKWGYSEEKSEDLLDKDYALGFLAANLTDWYLDEEDRYFRIYSLEGEFKVERTLIPIEIGALELDNERVSGYKQYNQKDIVSNFNKNNVIPTKYIGYGTLNQIPFSAAKIKLKLPYSNKYYEKVSFGESYNEAYSKVISEGFLEYAKMYEEKVNNINKDFIWASGTSYESWVGSLALKEIYDKGLDHIEYLKLRIEDIPWREERLWVDIITKFYKEKVYILCEYIEKFSGYKLVIMGDNHEKLAEEIGINLKQVLRNLLINAIGKLQIKEKFAGYSNEFYKDFNIDLSKYSEADKRIYEVSNNYQWGSWLDMYEKISTPEDTVKKYLWDYGDELKSRGIFLGYLEDI